MDQPHIPDRIMVRWAAEEGERLGRDVGADEIERRLFDSARTCAGRP
ncbi:hypothetical protein [Streptomyces sp. P9-2]